MTDSLPSGVPEFLVPGTNTSIGSFHFTADKIMKFASQFDPQRFHLDPDLAKKSVLGGLCASGWQTVSAWMKLQRNSIAEKTAELRKQNKPWPEFGPSPGMQDVRWLLPVYAGQIITYTNHIVNLRKSRSRPEWWLMENHVIAENEDGQRVMEFRSTVFLKIHDL